MRTIYWLRFAYRRGKEQETLHVADFPSKNALNDALVRLHRYEGDQYMLASSGDRKVAFHYKLNTPRQWSEFVNMRKFEDDVVEAYKLPPPSKEARAAIARMQRKDRDAKAKRVPSAMDTVHPPVEIPKGWPPNLTEDVDAIVELGNRSAAAVESLNVAYQPEPRYPHYEQIRSAILLTSAAVAVGAIYFAIYLLWEWWS